jgi:hypothetical protein
MAEFTPQYDLKWIKFDNGMKSMKVYAERGGVTPDGEPVKLPAVNAVIDNPDVYDALFSIPATITLNGENYSGVIGEMLAYLASCAVRREKDTWPLSQAELDKFGTVEGVPTGVSVIENLINSQ